MVLETVRVDFCMAKIGETRIQLVFGDFRIKSLSAKRRGVGAINRPAVVLVWARVRNEQCFRVVLISDTYFKYISETAKLPVPEAYIKRWK